ncbi:hypothetical protein WJX72_000905 [[Myrmecia] bisecta]|uniref:Acyl-[acyl-carrier-protein] desaturase n=1 Tax=[Myrmecia] bisecta TaxID=41462 RepID=A0AAW1R458_9CHLO
MPVTLQPVACLHFLKGECRVGDGCHFSHDVDAHRPICRFFSRSGHCRNGDRCRFAHDCAPMTEVSTTSLGPEASSSSSTHPEAAQPEVWTLERLTTCTLCKECSFAGPQHVPSKLGNFFVDFNKHIINEKLKMFPPKDTQVFPTDGTLEVDHLLFCSPCDRWFCESGPCALAMHVAAKHPGSRHDQALKSCRECPDCHKQFKTGQGVLSHFRDVHSHMHLLRDPFQRAIQAMQSIESGPDSDDSYDGCDDDMAQWERNCGFTDGEMSDLLCQGVKPWDDDAGDVLAALSSILVFGEQPAPDYQAHTGVTMNSQGLAKQSSTILKSSPSRALSARPRQRSSNAEKPVGEAPTIINGQILHSLSAHQFDLVNSMEKYVEERVLTVLKPVEKCWQPSDFLPDAASADFLDQVAELRKRTDCLPDDYLVVLIGDMITEEALPTYMAMLNTLDGVRDETGASPSVWGRWTRQWTAEENRHGDLMNKYIWLTGRVNMKAVEVTIQNLIGSGMDPKTENNPYLGFIYTSFQERATKISHGNTARHATEYGDKVLGTICGAIAQDEGRHEIAYTRIVDGLFERDPSGATVAFADMMRKQIVMPAHLMDDMEHPEKTGGRNLFADFSNVAQATGTYTAFDYADIMEHLIKRWNISSLTGLNADAQQAQEYLCKQPPRIRKLSERSMARRAKAKTKDTPFSWIYNRPVNC